MRIQLDYDYQRMEWRVSGPTENYRTCRSGELQLTISKVITDHMDYLHIVAAHIAGDKV